MTMSYSRQLRGVIAILATGLILTGHGSANAGIGDTGIATWKDNYSGAVSLTIDDAGTDRVDTLAILDDYGVKGTFYMNTQTMNAQGPAYLSAFQNASLNGHEIGSHTITHPGLTGMTNAQIHNELSVSQNFLENLTGKPVLTLAYPFGDVDNRVANIAKQYYIAARNVWPDAIHPATGQDMHWLGEALGPFNWTDAQFIQERFNFAESAQDTGGWAIEMYHNMGAPGSLNVELFHTEAAIRGHLANLTSGGLSVWVAPVVDVAQYYLSREGAQVSSSYNGSDAVTVGLTLSDPAGNITAPLTMLTTVPGAWDTAQIQVEQGGSVLPFTHASAGGDRELTYTALPNGGDVLVSLIQSTLIGDLDGDGFVGITDLNLILSGWNQNVPPANANADPSGDGFIGIEDLNVVLGNWNAGTAPPADAVIPEPGSVLIMTLGSTILMRRYKIEIA